jgi:transglutaminase/protease-like cytokinesis protein 3
MRKIVIIWFFTLVWQVQAQTGDFNKVDFDAVDKIALSLKGEGLNNLPLLAHNLTNKFETDVERFRAIYVWVSQNIQNDYYLMLKNDRKRRKFKNDSLLLNNWNDTFKREVFQILLKDKRTLCTGYTYLIKELASLAGLECEIVDGYGKTGKTALKNMTTPNHSWNAVKLNNKWYLADATWSSGFIDGDTYLFEFNYNDAYFLMEPQQFAEEHRPIEKKWALQTKASSIH